jgi:hypothetical protein
MHALRAQMRTPPPLAGEVAERSEAGGGKREDSYQFTPSPTLPRKRGREKHGRTQSVAALGHAA